MTSDPVEFAREEMARTTAERIPETSYEAEKAAMDEVISDDIFDQKITDDERPDESQIEGFAEIIRRENLVFSMAGRPDYSDFSSLLKNKQAASAFEDHFSMDPVEAKAAFVTIYVGTLFVANQGSDPEQIEIIIRNADVYREAIRNMYNSI